MGVLLERDAALAGLDEALARSRTGAGSSLVVSGPAGIGKSRLLEALHERTGPDVLVLTARGRPLEQEFPFGVVRQLLERTVADGDRRRALLAGPAALALPALGPVPTGEPTGVDAAFSIRHGLYWLVADLALERPLVLIVDDAHWADAPSLRALSHLITRLDGLPVLLAIGRRSGDPGPAPPLLDELECSATTVVRPRPLSERGVRALVADRLGAPPTELVRALRSATGGNPFLLEELLRALRADGLDATTVRPASVERLGPQAVARALLLRLGRLDRASVPVARAVAVLEGRADHRHVTAVSGIEPAEVGRTVDLLVRAEILRPGRPWAFLHPTMRAAVYEDTPPSALTALHARAVAILREDDRAAAEIAPHLLATEPAGDALTVEGLRAAAAQAIGQGAPDLARRYLVRALEEPPADADHAAVLGDLGEAESLAGDLDAAIGHLAGALDRTTATADRPPRALALHRALFARGRLDDAVALLEAELRRIDGLDPDVVLRVEAALDSVGLLHPSTVGRASTRLSRRQDLAGDTPNELLQLANVACWKWARGTASETVVLARRALADARVQAADPSDSIPIFEALWALAHTDEVELTRSVVRQAVDDARARGSVFGMSTCASLLTLLALRTGDTAGAVAEARGAAPLPGLSDFVRPPLLGALARALVWRGDLDAADAVIAESGCGPRLPEFVCLNPVFGARGRLRLEQGRIDEALADFRELGARSARIGLANPVDGWRLGAAEALARSGRPDEAVALADEQLDLARRWGTTSAIGIALHVRAVVGHAGPDALAEAERMLRTAPDRLEHARCLVDLGVSLRRAGRRRDARDPLRHGLDAARRCGATPLAQRAHDELLVAGARPRRLMFSGVEALTPSERRVADMAASGRSNREIAQALYVTPKTVENQLGRAYRKLGVSSRAALPAALDDAPPDVAASARDGSVPGELLADRARGRGDDARDRVAEDRAEALGAEGDVRHQRAARRGLRGDAVGVVGDEPEQRVRDPGLAAEDRLGPGGLAHRGDAGLA